MAIGLQGTYKSSNLYDDKMQDFAKKNNLGAQVSLFQIATGATPEGTFHNPFVRMHKSIEQYPHFHDDMDDATMWQTDTFERLKPYKPAKGTTVGASPIFPIEDNDQKFQFYDL